MANLCVLILCGLAFQVVHTTGQRQAELPTIDAELPLRLGDEKKAPRTWPNAKVPYKISSAVVDTDKIRLIDRVIRDIEDNTCIRFTNRRFEDEYMNIQTDRMACSAQVGVQTGINQLNLADSCWNYPTIAHMVLHVLGLYHENNRADRDDYVEINAENLRGLNARKFEKIPANQFPVLDTPYDLNSITHFPNKIYGIKQSGSRDWTIQAKRNPSQQLGGNRITANDYRKLKKLYRCQ
ncbi:putative Zinc metalloproteinase nas-14 [Hypsibius exemplaris]|uniref:Metalloendopeptidase n=1 Tax=Hypsibius exemplaris TaxID=2072580 RepID=A0A1W0WDW9_HYPEX|nr:putative Zinc metalloproteinase nas-14 [Hypsibius exemplaris]